MALTLDSLELPPDLIWTDEFDWTPVKQTITEAVDGSLIVETGLLLAGRPITLSGAIDSAWIDRGTLKSLYAYAQSVSERTLTLLDGRSFTVIFRHGEKPVEAAQVVSFTNPDDTDYYTLTVRLLQVS
jgi:hypothetical protein